MEITETEAEPTTPPRSFFAKSHISSVRSDTSSVRDFKQLAHRLSFRYNASVSSRSQGSAISIDSRESWDFSKVTGMPKDSKASDAERERAAFQKSCEWTSDQWLKVLTRELEKKVRGFNEILIEVLKPAREKTYLSPWPTGTSAMPAFREKFRQLAMILEYHEFGIWVVDLYRSRTKTEDTCALTFVVSIQQSIRIILEKFNTLLRDPVAANHLLLIQGTEAMHKLDLLYVKVWKAYESIAVTCSLYPSQAPRDPEVDFELHRLSWLEIREEVLEAVDNALAMAIRSSDGEKVGADRAH